MLYLALALGVLGLLLALVALGRAASLAAALERLEGDAGRRATQRTGERDQALETLRRQVAALVGGARLSPDQVLEGRLWRDVDGAEGERLVREQGARLLDVRTPAETAAGVVPGALRVPVDQLEQRLGELPRDGRPLVVYCAMGSRSAYACELLAREGFEGLFNLDGGIGAWRGALERPGAS